MAPPERRDRGARVVVLLDDFGSPIGDEEYVATVRALPEDVAARRVLVAEEVATQRSDIVVVKVAKTLQLSDEAGVGVLDGIHARLPSTNETIIELVRSVASLRLKGLPCIGREVSQTRLYNCLTLSWQMRWRESSVRFANISSITCAECGQVESVCG